MSTMLGGCAVVKAPPEVESITFALGTVETNASCKPAYAPTARMLLIAALTKAGYRLVDDDAAPHDAEIDVKSGFLRLRTGSTVLYQAEESVGCFDDWAANGMVNALGNSGKLQALAGARIRPAPVPRAAPASPAAQSRAETWPDIAKPPRATGEGASDAALIMGVEDYVFVPKVPGAAKNAIDWYTYLVDGRQVPVSQVRVLRNHDATREGILKAANEVGRLVRPGGTLWVVFIGHGAPSSDFKEGVLVGADAQQSADGLYARSVRQSELTAALGAGKTSVMVLDACFSGRSSDGKAMVPTLQPLVPLRLASGGATTLLTAGKAHEFAGPLPGLDRPAFSYLVLGALRGWGDTNGDGTVTAQEAVDYATKALTILPLGRSQTPQIVGDGAMALSRRADEKGPSLSAMVSGGERGPAQPPPDPGETCTRAGSTLLGCGFENEPSWLGECRADPEYVACLQSAGTDCQALAMCGFRYFSTRSCQGRGVPAGTAGCKATTACQAGCGPDAACVCRCNAAMSPARAVEVGIQNQCAELHCKGCGGPGKPSCDACFSQHCGAKFNQSCEGK